MWHKQTLRYTYVDHLCTINTAREKLFQCVFENNHTVISFLKAHVEVGFMIFVVLIVALFDMILRTRILESGGAHIF